MRVVSPLNHLSHIHRVRVVNDFLSCYDPWKFAEVVGHSFHIVQAVFNRNDSGSAALNQEINLLLHVIVL